MKRFSFASSDHHHQVDMASVLMLLSRGRAGEEMTVTMMNHRRVFECKTCNRQFPSFQALGGHRASHKKARLSDDTNQSPAANKPRVHECSICGLEFSIGQALGGHMRRHRAASDGFGHHHQGFVEKIKSSANGKRVVLLDLNLPPSDEEVDCKKLGLELELSLGGSVQACESHTHMIRGSISC